MAGGVAIIDGYLFQLRLISSRFFLSPLRSCLFLFRTSTTFEQSVPVLDNFFPSQVVLVATAAVVFYAAVTDFRTFTISNNLIVALIFLFVLYASISGRWSEVPWNIGFVVLIFLIPFGFMLSGGWAVATSSF